MVNFPVLVQLDVEGYGLYPGSPSSPTAGLHVEFHPGLTLVLGANGLGKTTLVNIVFRLLTGPFDIPGLAGRAELGTTRLAAAPLSPSSRKIFAQRVVDGARQATAKLTFKLSQTEIAVTRRLSDLTLIDCTIDGRSAARNEEAFHAEITHLAGVWSFGDWILLLRHLVFYFEDRRALVWDATAQRQILRAMFLPAATARKWTEDERAILETDSRMRNLSAALYREEGTYAQTESRAVRGAEVRDELQTLQEHQQVELAQRERLQADYLDVDVMRQQARLRLLKAEQARESKFRANERTMLLAIGARFPSRSETARYILAQLLTEQVCLVCGSHAPDAALAYAARVDGEVCIICESDLGHDQLAGLGEDIRESFGAAAANMAQFERDVAEAQRELSEAESSYERIVAELSELSTRIAERSERIDSLIRRLPPEEAEMHQQRRELASMRNRVEELKSELVSKRALFSGFLEGITVEMLGWSDRIKFAFQQFAEGFLLEQVSLVWSPQRDTVGQGGTAVVFPAFELEMTGTDFPSPVRRSAPEQVSESQREFIDLAFRMALMSLSGETTAGSLVVDAPESSLDAVFAERAADVLARYADPRRGNRLLVTSNLVEGDLIPTLIARSMQGGDARNRIVDLLTIATPTAAVKTLYSEYEALRDQVIGRGIQESQR